MSVRRPIVILVLAIMAIPAITTAQDDTDNRTHIVTGCLRKGAVEHVYYLTDKNGKMWVIRSRAVRLGPHAGHTVTVTGTNPKRQPSGDTSPQNDLLATKVEEVRDSCAEQ
jgi:hypothetical protein